MEDEHKYFIGQLSDADRRLIRGLSDPTGERISEEEKPQQIQRVLGLLQDPRNVGLIADSMPPSFYGFSVGLREQQPGLNACEVVKQYLSGLLAGNVQ
ncbi:hypothetical protein HYT18_00365 [Candidatus Microgenomates bacterium]|nr:hypothetical protein [Candidatus Microgenomates bacterium]